MRIATRNALKLNRFPRSTKPRALPYPKQAIDLTQARYFSNDDFRKTLNKMNEEFSKSKTTANDGKKEGEENIDDDKATNTAAGSSFTPPSLDLDRIKTTAWETYDFFADNIRLAYGEMMGEQKESNLSRKVEQAASFRRATPDDEEDEWDDEKKKKTNEEDDNVDPGPSAIVHVKDPKSAWESMKERLQDSPFIRDILKNSRRMGQQAAATDVGKAAADMGRSVNEKVEDAREFWETSQNPLVYTISGVWDSLTGETEEGITIAEIRKLDPKFSKEEWAAEVKEHLAPKIIKAHLEGNTKELKPWLGEAVYNKLAADIRTRKHDGIVFDTRILDIDENQILLRFLENGGPVIVVIYMVQQINCIRNRKGEIIEGGETEIRAKFYSMAFQQNYDDDDGTVEWKIVDYEFAGDMPYY